MFKNKAQLKRDLLLIGIVTVVVIGVILLTFLTRTVGDTAIIKYENITLFEVSMDSGSFRESTEVYNVDKNHIIIVEDSTKIYIKETENSAKVEFTKLKKGEGVIRHGDNEYYIMGDLGIVHILYSPERKMIKVVKETSPKNVCSKQGFSNNAPIVCLPNLVFISFSNSDLDDVIG